jgi:hypothetical protein
MTRPDRDYDDTLSRVLRSTLDPLEPAGDGLAKIQKRIAEPWLKRRVSLLRTDFAALMWLIFVRCEPLLTRVRSGVAALGTGSARHRRTARRPLGGATAQPAPGEATARATTFQYRVERDRGGLNRWVGPTMVWLRPALAVGGAVVIVVAGVFAFGQVREALISTAGSGSPGSTGNGQHHAPKPGVVNGSGSPGLSSAGHHASGPSPAHKPAGKAGNRETPRPSPTCSAAPTPTSSPTTSPSPTPTPTSPTPNPTTPTPSGSPTTPTGGDASPSPSAGSGAAADDAAVLYPGQLVLRSCNTSAAGGSGAGSGHPTASPPSAS